MPQRKNRTKRNCRMNKEGQKVRRIPAEGIDNSQNDEMFPPVKGGDFYCILFKKILLFFH